MRRCRSAQVKEFLSKTKDPKGAFISMSDVLGEAQKQLDGEGHFAGYDLGFLKAIQ